MTDQPPHKRRLRGSSSITYNDDGVGCWVQFEQCGHTLWLANYRQTSPSITRGPSYGRCCPECNVRSRPHQVKNPNRCRLCKRPLSRYNRETVCAGCASL